MPTSCEIELYLYQLKKKVTPEEGRKFVLKSPEKKGKKSIQAMTAARFMDSYNQKPTN